MYLAIKTQRTMGLTAYFVSVEHKPTNIPTSPPPTKKNNSSKKIFFPKSIKNL